MVSIVDVAEMASRRPVAVEMASRCLFHLQFIIIIIISFTAHAASAAGIGREPHIPEGGCLCTTAAVVARKHG